MANTNGWSSAVPAALWLEQNLVCCAVCGLRLKQGQMIVDKHVYKNGELDYISLAHEGCSRYDTSDPHAQPERTKCGHCGNYMPKDMSCICFDNGCE